VTGTNSSHDRAIVFPLGNSSSKSSAHFRSPLLFHSPWGTFQTTWKLMTKKKNFYSDANSLKRRLKRAKFLEGSYRVRSRTLETVFLLLSRDLANSRDKIRVAGPTILWDDAADWSGWERPERREADIQKSRRLLRNGELSTAGLSSIVGGAYKTERERAQTNINGILLRLREEPTSYWKREKKDFYLLTCFWLKSKNGRSLVMVEIKIDLSKCDGDGPLR